MGQCRRNTDRLPCGRVPSLVERRKWRTLPTEDAALVLLFSLVASGQIKLRKIDGWQKIGAVLNQHTAVVA